MLSYFIIVAMLNDVITLMLSVVMVNVVMLSVVAPYMLAEKNTISFCRNMNDEEISFITLVPEVLDHLTSSVGIWNKESIADLIKKIYSVCTVSCCCH